MGNNNSTPAKEAADPPASDLNAQLPIKRYHSVQTGGRDASIASDAQQTRPADKPGAPKLGRTGSIFGRTSSHDGAGTPGRVRSRSGSVSGFFSQRRGSSTANPPNAPALASSTEAMRLDATPTLEDYSSKLAAPAAGSHAGAADFDVTSPNGTGIETAVRSAPRARRVTDGHGTLPPPAAGFDQRTFVPSHPSPSVAMHAHYASGLPSHHAGTTAPSGLRSSSSSRTPSETAPAEPKSDGRDRPNLSSRSSNRHPLFGIEGGNNGLYTSAGNSKANSAAASPSIGGTSPTLSPQVVPENENGQDPEASNRPLAALPSYLKIPTTIPSSHVQPSSPSASVYPHHSDQPSSLAAAPKDEDGRPTHLVGGSGAAAAIVDAVDVVISPGNASKASSPVGSRKASISSADGSKAYSELNVDAARAAGIDVTDLPLHLKKAGAEDVEDTERVPRSLERSSEGSAGASASGTSRTPTPTPSAYGARAMTPTNKDAMRMRSLSPGKAPATSIGAPTGPVSRRPHVDVQTGGGESGFTTPLLPPGLTSAPPSASQPGDTPLADSLALTPTGERMPPLSSNRTGTSQPSTPSSTNQNHMQQQQSQLPLMPIVLTWRAGGREVFVTGTFANEWRSKILLHKAKRDHSCVLHLPPGTHRLKFIVDDRWRTSRELPTATDGDGNLVNYVEIPNVGPAHPGPLSAPGEDFAENVADKTRSDRNSKIDSKKTTMNLVEEARRAEAAQLEDIFDEDGKDQEEMWTNEIPTSLIEAQEAEEALREAMENERERHKDNQDSAALPNPPALPRQLEKVILNSSPANPNNGGSTGSTVDDNSILPAPNHVVLNHLTASSIKGGVLAVGTTTRYKRKYVTTVYYRPVQI